MDQNQTGGDIVHAEVKNKRDSYSYVSTCKYIIASNFRPDLGEDDALENRFLTIPFPNSVPDRQKNYHLLDDINIPQSGDTAARHPYAAQPIQIYQLQRPQEYFLSTIDKPLYILLHFPLPLQNLLSDTY